MKKSGKNFGNSRIKNDFTVEERALPPPLSLLLYRKNQRFLLYNKVKLPWSIRVAKQPCTCGEVTFLINKKVAMIEKNVIIATFYEKNKLFKLYRK
jgi:hypothetical protein